MIFPFS